MNTGMNLEQNITKLSTTIQGKHALICTPSRSKKKMRKRLVVGASQLAAAFF
jgi:hypothetical protein